MSFIVLLNIFNLDRKTKKFQQLKKSSLSRGEWYKVSVAELMAVQELAKQTSTFGKQTFYMENRQDLQESYSIICFKKVISKVSITEILILFFFYVGKGL